MRPYPALFLSALCAFPSAVTGCSQATDQADTGSSDDHLNQATDLFNTTAAASFDLSAPFSQLISRYRNQQADPPAAGAAGPVDPSYSELGTLTFAGKPMDVRIGIRGNTSPRDCAFPKYKLEFLHKEQTAGTPFDGHKKLRVNSHCGNGTPADHSGQFSRVQNEISPIREELAYRTIRAAGVPTYGTRLAKITYKDSSAASPLAQMTRHGLVIEAGDDAAKRFASAGLIDAAHGVYLNDPHGQPEHAGANQSLMKPDQVAAVYLAEVLVANYDWIFQPGSPGAFWNVDVFGIANQANQLPIPQDFDLATGVQAIQDPSSMVNAQIATFRGVFASKPDVAKRAGAAFVLKKAAIAQEIAAAEKEGIAAGRLPSSNGTTTTDQGFVNAHKQFDLFFALPELKASP